MEGSKLYYQLRKDERWIENGSPFEIGGRPTDVEQIYYSLNEQVQGCFESIPVEIKTELYALHKVLKEAEEQIDRIVGLTSLAKLNKAPL